MIEIVNHPDVAKWVISGIPDRDMSDVGPHQAMGVAINGKPAGGVIYSCYDKRARSIAVWVRGTPGVPWLKKPILKRLFDTAFTDMDCESMIACVREGNKPSEKLIRHLGFRKEGVRRRGWDGKTNMLIFGMLKSECKYI